MPAELLIAAGPGEWRAALLEGAAAVELYVERGDRCEAGSLHLGRVLRLVPNLSAALIDIGDERPAFLPLGEMLRRGRPVEEGARVIVQIRREAQAGKAARATMRITAEQAIEARAAALDPPARLDPAAGFAQGLARALTAKPERVAADDHAAIAEIRAAFPAAAVEYLAAPDWPVDLDALFDEALMPSLALPGGGTLHIEATQAATLIDVDSGGAAPLAANLEAAAAIARALRLRNIGGGIVVDFIGLDSKQARERVRAALARALAPDPAGGRVLGWTRLGHLELVRPRRGRPLAEALGERAHGGLVKSAATLAFAALRALARAARAEPHRDWR
ncbi:MAG TPA: ribonuclease E/G, partial [Stellaceae bacterium]|nr:ribonuclease E/G [Stellaceae bacterium]